MMEMSKDLVAVLKIVEEACPQVLEWSDNPGAHTADYKEDGSPVTVVDKKLNDYLVEKLAEAFPGDALIGEESESHEAGSQSRIWYIDPIDGTKEFVKQTNQWSIMVGLCVDHVATIGVVAQPESGLIYYAEKDGGAYCKQLGDSDVKLLMVKDGEELTMIGSNSTIDIHEPGLMKEIGIVKKIRHGSIGLKASKIAEGSAHLYVNSKNWCSYWDLVPSEVILKEAGGEVLDFQLQPLKYDPSRGVAVDYGFIMGSKSVIQSNRDVILGVLK